ncbi:MarR family winged helix-turn-helix transcriptional regulator [Ottowia caeni]|uniref:MarR family winged helix-turn-helix transcriptional regulator n=1 Tax=Ottowia caeni TaxID=2870339 RepID=UPI003D76164B
MTSHKNLLRHLLMARSSWMEEQVTAAASLHGYPYVTTAMNRLFAHLGGRPIGLSELARRLSVSRQAVHKLASEAEKLGLVEFVPDESDKRVMLLRFTQKGWRMSESAAASFVKMEEELARHIGKENVEELRRILSLPWPSAASNARHNSRKVHSN